MRTSRPHPQHRNASRQKGAAAVFVAVALIAMITAVALAIDLGRLFVAQKELDKAADMAAMAGAEAASGCKGPDSSGIPANLADITTTVRDTILSNGGSAAWMTGFNGAPTVETGRTAVTPTGIRTFSAMAAGNAQADSVRVTLTRPTPQPLVPMWLDHSGTLVASSTARQSVMGSFSVVAGVLNIDTSRSLILNGLLSGLLGGAVNLSVADYQALLAVGVSMDAIKTAVDIDGEGIELETPLLPDVLEGLVEGLGDGANTQVRQLLMNLAGAAQNKPVPMGDILSPVADALGAVPFVNLLDLIVAMGAAAAADQGETLMLPLNVNVPGVLTTVVQLKILEPPQIGYGRPGEAYAKTAAVKVGVRIDAGSVLSSVIATVNGLLSGLLNTLTGLLNLLGVVVFDTHGGPQVATQLKIGIDVDVAQATARLDSVHCPSHAAPELTTGLSASPALASINIGTFNGTPSSSYMPPLIPAQDIDILDLSLSARLLFLDLGTLNLNLGLGFSCVSVGGMCGGPEDPYAAPFTPLPRLVDQFNRITLPLGPPYERAIGAIGDPPLVNRNPQRVGTELTPQVGLVINSTKPGTGTLGKLGDALNGIISAIGAVLDPVLDTVGAVLDTLVGPLLAALGINLGEATVYMNTVSIDRPTIVTRCIPGAAAPYGCAAAN